MIRYRVIVADPPWAFGDRLTMSDTRRGAESQYSTLTVETICALPVRAVAEDDALLALWCPSALILDGTAARVVEAWGFQGKQLWTWCKTTKTGRMAFGMGRLGRNCTEHAILATRGRIYQHVVGRSEQTAFLHPTLPHSAKPETLQDQLERMIPGGRRLELFARRIRSRWTCVGDQCPATEGQDIREWFARRVTP